MGALVTPLILFAPGFGLGIWLGHRAERDEPPSRLLPYAAIAWAATAAWGFLCWWMLFAVWGPGLREGEARQGAVLVAQIAAINALPGFLATDLFRRARRAK